MPAFWSVAASFASKINFHPLKFDRHLSPCAAKFYAPQWNRPPKFDLNFTRRIERSLKFIQNFRPLRQIYSSAALVNFTRLRALCLATASLRRAPGFKTGRDRLKFHGAVCEPYDPKEMHACIIF